MNERCREALYHSWGKAPERKKLEKDYNRSYYQKNKYKWGVKGAVYPDNFVGPKPPEPPKPPTAADHMLTGVGYVMTAMPGANYLYDSPQQYANYIKEDISVAKRFVKKVANVGKDVVRASKEAIAAGKKFVENLNVVKKWKQFIKEGQDYMKEYY